MNREKAIWIENGPVLNDMEDEDFQSTFNGFVHLLVDCLTGRVCIKSTSRSAIKDLVHKMNLPANGFRFECGPCSLDVAKEIHSEATPK